jgi:hypothetical protein
MKSYLTSLNLFFSDRQTCQHGLPTDHEMAKRLAKLKVKTVTIIHAEVVTRVASSLGAIGLPGYPEVLIYNKCDEVLTKPSSILFYTIM